MSSTLAARRENLDGARVGFVGDDADDAGGAVSIVRAALARRHPLRETTLLRNPLPDLASRAAWVSDAAARCDAVVLSVSAVDQTVGLLELAGKLEELGIPSVLVLPNAIGVDVEELAAGHDLAHVAVVEFADAGSAPSSVTGLVLSVERALCTDPSGVGRFQHASCDADPDGSCAC